MSVPKRYSIIRWLLSQEATVPRRAMVSMEEWNATYDTLSALWSETADRSIAGGFLSDGMASVFLSGFRSALFSLFPFLPVGAIPAFCVSERGGNTPRHIETRLENPLESTSRDLSWTLTGEKTFVTCSNVANLLFIAASVGAGEDGRNQIRLVSLPSDTPGVEIIPAKDLSFIPEIKHGVIRLNRVRLNDSSILPGDAYDRYVKPFRLLEDIHILSATLGYLFHLAGAYSWPRQIMERLLFLISGVRELSTRTNELPEAHLIYSGLRATITRFIDELAPQWRKVPEPIREAWERDKPLLEIARKVEKKRAENAWEYFDSQSRHINGGKDA